MQTLSLSVGFENTVSYEAGISYVRGQGMESL